MFTKVEYRRIQKKKNIPHASRAPVAAAGAVADIGASAGGAGGAVDTRVVVLTEGWRARVDNGVQGGGECRSRVKGK